MTNHFVSSKERILPKATVKTKELSGKNWTLWTIGVGIGLLGGTIFLFGAIFLTAVEFIYSETPHGNWLFLLVLPLWVLGAHCLDKSEEAEKRERRERCRQSGMTYDDCVNK